MKLYRLIVVLSLLLPASEAGKAKQPSQIARFKSWKTSYNKIYASPEEEARVMKKFVKNLDAIEAHNQRYKAGLETFERGLWKRSDLSFEEKQRLLAASKVNESQSEPLTLQASPKKLKSSPASVNWTAAGLVHPVEDQDVCGSCYAFTTVGIIEGIMLKKKMSHRLSVQQIVDCDREDKGCDGGDPIVALKYAKKQGLTHATQYPYTSKRGKCKSFSPISDLSSVSRVTLNGDENRLKSYVANYGPVGVAINAADSLMNYMSGVYTNKKCSKSPDHAVLLVGYGTDSSLGDYWLVKNSWGTSWGEQGYVRMGRNRKNLCGIANTVWYAV